MTINTRIRGPKRSYLWITAVTQTTMPRLVNIRRISMAVITPDTIRAGTFRPMLPGASIRLIPIGSLLPAAYHYRCGLPRRSGRGDGLVAAALPQRPADLVAMVPRHTDGDLAWRIANGRGFMPSWKQVLDKQQMWDVVN